MKTSASYFEIINQFMGKRILVIGDLLLDIYVKGRSTRLCPEAPVPVVDVQERTVLPGGAANTVCNLHALGAKVTFCSVIGNDSEGEEALRLMHSLEIDDDTILRSNNRRTITKARIVSAGQLITRIDQGSDEPVNDEFTAQLVQRLENVYPSCDAVIISDYDKGVVTVGLLDALVALQRRYKKFIAVDSKRLEFFARLAPSYAKPNYDEVVKLLSLPRVDHRREQIRESAAALYEKIQAPLISVTLDKDGSIIIENGTATLAFTTPQVDKAFVSGAGDSFISAFVLAYINSSKKDVSAEIATAAAAIAIRKACTATCSHAELRSYFQIQSKWIPGLKDLEQICENYRRQGKRIVFTNGCFDILHSGHVTYLHQAKQCGDILIVGLNTDDSIRRIKGPTRPINTLSDRLQVLAGLSSVDLIIPFGSSADDTPIPLIKVVRPDVFVKGGDYTKETLPEADTVEQCGGKIVLIEPVPNHSTTRIINRINGFSVMEKSYSKLGS